MTFLSIYQHNLKNIRHSEKSQIHGLEKYNTNSFTAKLTYICYTSSNYQSSQKKTINLTWNWVKVSPLTSPESMMPRYTVPPFPVLINPFRLL